MLSLFLAALAACTSQVVVPDATTTDTAEVVDDGFTPVENGTSSGSGNDGGDTETDTDDTEDDEVVTQAYFADCDEDGVGGSAYVIASSEPSDAPQGVCTSGRWVTIGGDCDDNDNDVYPGATEADNDVDDDCDGSVDENLGSSNTATYTTYYRDADGDGYGSASSTASATSQPTGYVTNDDDCNDSDDDVSPADSEGSTEDGVDNDCDGSVDEGTSSSSSGSSDGDAVTVTICVVDVASGTEEYDLYVLDLDGSSAYWFDAVFLDESDADGCRTFATKCGSDLKFQGFGDDTEFWGDYLSGTCQGDEDGWLVEEDDGTTCAALEIEVDGDSVDEFSGDDLFHEVSCD